MTDLLQGSLREALASCEALREENERVREVSRARAVEGHRAKEEIEVLRATRDRAEKTAERLAKLVDAFIEADRAVGVAQLARKRALSALEDERTPF